MTTMHESKAEVAPSLDSKVSSDSNEAMGSNVVGCNRCARLMSHMRKRAIRWLYLEWYKKAVHGETLPTIFELTPSISDVLRNSLSGLDTGDACKDCGSSLDGLVITTLQPISCKSEMYSNIQRGLHARDRTSAVKDAPADTTRDVNNNIDAKIDNRTQLTSNSSSGVFTAPDIVQELASESAVSSQNMTRHEQVMNTTNMRLEVDVNNNLNVNTTDADAVGMSSERCKDNKPFLTREDVWPAHRVDELVETVATQSLDGSTEVLASSCEVTTTSAADSSVRRGEMTGQGVENVGTASERSLDPSSPRLPSAMKLRSNNSPLKRAEKSDVPRNSRGSVSASVSATITRNDSVSVRVSSNSLEKRQQTNAERAPVASPLTTRRTSTTRAVQAYHKDTISDRPYHFSSLIMRQPPEAPPALFKYTSRRSDSHGKVRLTLRVADSEPGNETASSLRVDARKKQVHLREKCDVQQDCAHANQSKLEKASKVYSFDSVLEAGSNLQELCSGSLVDLLHNVVNGNDACLLMYGQEEMGKTSAMIGSDDTTEHIGIIPSAISWLYQLIEDRKQRTGARFSIRISVVEVSGKLENIKDLLLEQGSNGTIGSNVKSPSVYLPKDKNATVQLSDFTELRSATPEKAALLLDEALAARTTTSVGSSDNLDDEHSGSSLIFTMHVYQYMIDKVGTGEVHGGRSRFHMIDLSRCDRRTKRSRDQGTSLTLSALGNVIVALANGSRHVPHKDSKLTMLLRETMGPLAARISFIANVSRDNRLSTETLSTLQMTSRIHRSRRKTNRYAGTSSSGADSSADELRHSRRRRNKPVTPMLITEACYSDTINESEVTSPSGAEESCDTVIYLGPKGEQLSDQDLTDFEHPPIYDSNQSKIFSNGSDTRASPIHDICSNLYSNKSHNIGPRIGARQSAPVYARLPVTSQQTTSSPAVGYLNLEASSERLASTLPRNYHSLNPHAHAQLPATRSVPSSPARKPSPHQLNNLGNLCTVSESQLNMTPIVVNVSDLALSRSSLDKCRVSSATRKGNSTNTMHVVASNRSNAEVKEMKDRYHHDNSRLNEERCVRASTKTSTSSTESISHSRIKEEKKENDRGTNKKALSECGLMNDDQKSSLLKSAKQIDSPLHSPLHSNLRHSNTHDSVRRDTIRTLEGESCYGDDDDDTRRLLDADTATDDVDDASLRRSDSMESVSSMGTVDNFERSLVSKIAERFAIEDEFADADLHGPLRGEPVVDELSSAERSSAEIQDFYLDDGLECVGAMMISRVAKRPHPRNVHDVSEDPFDEVDRRRDVREDDVIEDDDDGGCEHGSSDNEGTGERQLRENNTERRNSCSSCDEHHYLSTGGMLMRPPSGGLSSGYESMRCASSGNIDHSSGSGSGGESKRKLHDNQVPHPPKTIYENSRGELDVTSPTIEDQLDSNQAGRRSNSVHSNAMRRPLSYIAMKSLLEERNDLKWQLEKTLSKLVLNHIDLPDVDERLHQLPPTTAEGSYSELLTRENRILQQKVDVCKSHLELVACLHDDAADVGTDASPIQDTDSPTHQKKSRRRADFFRRLSFGWRGSPKHRKAFKVTTV